MILPLSYSSAARHRVRQAFMPSFNIQEKVCLQLPGCRLHTSKMQDFRNRQKLFVQIFIPFHGKEIFFLIVALLACWNKVGFCTSAASDQRNNMVHSQSVGSYTLPAVMTPAASQLLLPPPGSAQLPGFCLFSPDRFIGDIRKKIDISIHKHILQTLLTAIKKPVPDR